MIGSGRQGNHALVPGAPQLLGRDTELQVIADLLKDEGGGALVLAGEPGIGKTSLLAAAREYGAQAGYQILMVAGSQMSADVPFSGLHMLLEHFLDRSRHLPAAQERALMTALGLQEGPAPQPFLVALATLDLLAEAAAEQPILVLVDDLQWVDHASADALAFVGRRLGYDPVVLLATARTHAGERPPPPDLPRLDLAGLPEDMAHRVVQHLRGDLPDRARDAIVQVCEGNPLALVELAHTWTGGQGEAVLADREGPTPTHSLSSRLEHAFVGRLQDLPQNTRDVVLVAAASSGDELPHVLTAASLLGTRTATVDDLQPAVETGLVHVDDLRVRFRHPLVRSGILQAVAPERLRAAHEAIAGALPGDEFRATWHHSLALQEPDEAVAARLEANHLQALQRGSALAAIQMLQRSAQLSPEPADAGRRLLLAAEHGFGLGRADLVRDLLDAAGHLDLPKLERARMRWLEEIFEDGRPGDPEPVFELCSIALQSASAGDVSLALNLLQGAGLRCWWADTGVQARERVVTTARSLTGVEHDPRYLAAIAMAAPVAQVPTVRRMLTLANHNLDPATEAGSLMLFGQAGHAVGEQALAADFLDRAEARLRSQGRLGLLSHVLGMQVQVRLDLGDWRLAAQAAQEGNRLAVDTGQPIWSAGTLVGDAKVAVLNGDTATALRLADAVEAQSAPAGIDDLMACAQLVRGIALLVDGHPDEAFTALASMFDRAGSFWHERETYGALPFLADAAVRSRQIPQAREIVADAERGYGELSAALLRINLQYAHAVLADEPDAEQLYRQALAVDLGRWPWPRARLELAYGSWLRRLRRGTEWRGPLRAALSTFEVIGAAPWAEIAREELRAAGERGGVQRPHAAVELTPQELQIARLAAAGLSNREIGEQLYLSPRTVGSHLYRLFPKLGVTARSQLAEVLASL